MAKEVFSSSTKLNLTSLDIYHKDLRFKLNKTFGDLILEQLNKISSSYSRNLHFYYKILNSIEYKLQEYLKFHLKRH